MIIEKGDVVKKLFVLFCLIFIMGCGDFLAPRQEELNASIDTETKNENLSLTVLNTGDEIITSFEINIVYEISWYVHYSPNFDSTYSDTIEYVICEKNITVKPCGSFFREYKLIDQSDSSNYPRISWLYV